MGKKLIIKGADFSANGIAPEFIKLAWIGSGAVKTSAMVIQNVSKNSKAVVNCQFYLSKLKDAPQSTYLFGSLTADRTLTVAQITSSAYMYIKSNSIYSKVDNTNISNGADVKIEISKNGLRINDGNLIPINSSNTSLDGMQDIAYFGLDTCVAGSGTTLDISLSADNNDPAMRLKSFKLYSDANDESSLTHDLIPVKRTADNVVCLYNKVDGTYIERADSTTPAYGVIE